ncbi:MAG: hypothetical protein V4717_03525 [Bacteroidota bacterium]
MKKLSLAFTATAALLFSVNVFAQFNGAVAYANTGKKTGNSENSEMKKLSASSLKSSKMTARAFKDFSKTFKNVTNADWVAGQTGGYIASFHQDESLNMVFYNDNGKYLYTIKRHTEKQLPKEIRHMVKTTYYDYAIIGAEEVLIDNKTIFLVHIKFDKYSKTIRIDENTMEAIEELENN